MAGAANKQDELLSEYGTAACMWALRAGAHPSEHVNYLVCELRDDIANEFGHEDLGANPMDVARVLVAKGWRR